MRPQIARAIPETGDGPRGMALLNAAGRRAAGMIADLSREPGTDERKLRAGILDELRTAITFDAYAWLLTDPSTEVGTVPLAQALARGPALKFRTFMTCRA